MIEGFDLGALVVDVVDERLQHPLLWYLGQAGQYPERGGVPVCFPWFGVGTDPACKPGHGVVKRQRWSLDREHCSNDVLPAPVGSGEVPVEQSVQRWSGSQLSFVLSSHDLSPEDRRDVRGRVSDQCWQARLTAKVQTGQVKSEQVQHEPLKADQLTLSLSLTVSNMSDALLEFEEALHTYYAVSDVRSITVDGLQGVPYWDATVQPYRQGCDDRALTFSGAVDRIYVGEQTVSIVDREWHRRIEVSKTGSANTVVWNPGEPSSEESGNRALDWRRGFVCVETANCRDHMVRLQPGQEHTMTCQIRVYDL